MAERDMRALRASLTCGIPQLREAAHAVLMRLIAKHSGNVAAMAGELDVTAKALGALVRSDTRLDRFRTETTMADPERRGRLPVGVRPGVKKARA